MDIEIQEISYGIAYQVTDGDKRYIQMNRHLKEYPALYNDVLSHEMEHMQSKNRYMDFSIDFKRMLRKSNGELFKFMLKHPMSFMCYSPILWTKKEGFSINVFALFPLSFILALIFCDIYIISLLFLHHLG